QIFDFNRIQTSDIVNYLEKISKEEAIEYEKDAFNIIAQKADGGMRDALSIYDQIISFSGNSVNYKNVIDNLNVLDYEYYFSMIDQFLKGDISNVMLTFNEILNQGFDARNFLSGLSSHFRNLLVSRDKITLTLMDVGENIKQRYLTQTAECGQDFLLNGLDLLNKADNQYNTSQNKRLHIEILLIQLCRLNEKKKNIQ
ncbi:MAG: DNA polymerase III subunit gamma/tau, partial [Bacteroidota bacterium]